ncbi:MAG: radical SAM protein [Candidatus Bathyarchaeia archaeon]
MRLITEFDPWGDPLCTCPRKYSLSPYVGCSHSCAYCYITSYIPDGFRCREKADFMARLGRDLARLRPGSLISMANSSDPYQPIEAERGLTRSALGRLLPLGHRVLLITKSDLVARDSDLLAKGNCSVSISISTIDDRLARRLEPLAPSPSKRLRAMGLLSSSGIPCSIRVDPIIPGINDDPSGLERLMAAAERAGCRHVIASTYKARWDNLRRVLKAFPKMAKELRRLYAEEGEALGGERYLPKALRRDILRTVKGISEDLGLSFSTCREGFPELGSARSCDGSHLIPLRIPARLMDEFLDQGQ